MALSQLNTNSIATGAITSSLVTSVSNTSISGTIIGTQLGSGLIGQVGFFGFSSAPTGWIKANGAAVSRTTYAALFAAIGTTYGSGDGSTTFNVPDLRGEFPRGWDDSRGIDSGRSIGTAQTSSRVLYAVAAAAGGYNQVGYAGFRYHADSYGVQDSDSSSETTTDQNTTADATGGASQNSRNYYRSIRPRNIALLACIKY